jgi:hypothetical protein
VNHPRLNQRVSTFDRRLFFAYAVCSLAAIFYLPLLVPQPPTTSVSYVFGYNNRVGVILVLLLVAIGSAWTKGLGIPLRTAGTSEPVRLKILAVSLLGVLFGCLAMYKFAGRFGGFGESSYFIDRAWLLSQGKIPYVDFEWAYGPLFIYCPVLLERWLHITVVQAYYLFWVVNCLVGTVLLFATVNMVDYPSKAKRSIFLLLYGSTFAGIVCMGANYTNLRFTSPLFFILVVHKLLGGNSARSRAYAAISTVLFTIILLQISPEIAIAHAFACAVIIGLADPNRGSGPRITLVWLAFAFVIVFGAALKLHVLDRTKVSGTLVECFPITFSPSILLFLAALFACAGYVFRRLTGERILDNTIGLIAYSIPMLAAALGRCDPGHVLYDGMGIFLASMFYASNFENLWKRYKAAFVIVMALLPAFTVSLLFYRPAIARIWTNPQNETVNLSSLYPSWHGTFLAPAGYKPNGVGTYLSPQVDYGHYEGFENAYTVEAIQEKLAEIKDHPDKALLLPSYFQADCQVNVPSDKFVMSLLFAFPYYGKAVHLESLRKPVCDYIEANYIMERAPTPQDFEYGLWVPNGDDHAAP